MKISLVDFFNKYVLAFLFFIAVFFLETVVARNEAKHAIISGESKFSRILSNPKYNLAIAMFYKSGKLLRKEDPALYEKNNKLSQMFKSTSLVFRYRDADLMFLSINLAEKHNEVFESMYGITGTPQFMLFKDGQIFPDLKGQPTVLKGFVTRPDLQAFIDNNFSILLKENSDRNKEIRERKMEEAMANSYYVGWGGYGYPGGYWGWGGPYWGAGYMGCAGYFGCGGAIGACGRGCGGYRGSCGGGRGGSCRR